MTTTLELNVATFALLLNFAWEILQAPSYAGMAGLLEAQVTRACLQATVGDTRARPLQEPAQATHQRREVQLGA